jgi:hypothetical protein
MRPGEKCRRQVLGDERRHPNDDGGARLAGLRVEHGAAVELHDGGLFDDPVPGRLS